MEGKICRNARPNLERRSEASMRIVHKYFGSFVKCQGQTPTGLKLHLNQRPHFLDSPLSPDYGGEDKGEGSHPPLSPAYGGEDKGEGV